MAEAYVKARDVEGAKRRIAPGIRADVLGEVRTDGYTVYHCTVDIAPQEGGYKIILQDLLPQTDVRQMKLRKKEMEQFLREIER